MSDLCSFDLDSVSRLKRRELQTLCKKCGIKSNSKSVVLVEELQAYHAQVRKASAPARRTWRKVV